MEWLNNIWYPPPAPIPTGTCLASNKPFSINMKFSLTSLIAVVAIALNAEQVQAGPLAMGLCYTACNVGMYIKPRLRVEC
jgi:hypothetical protein